MRFSLLDPSSKKLLVFPITPNSLKVSMGAKTISYSHIMLGDSTIPRGTSPINIQFSGILPTGDSTVPRASKLNANQVIKDIKTWQAIDRKKLKLIITDTPWNLDVLIESFEPEYEGPLINYSISLVEYKRLVINVHKKKTPKRAVTAKKQKIYVVKKGDNLWNIAKRYTGKGIKWKEMWRLNKTKSRSKNPNLIYPGEKFTIPSGW